MENILTADLRIERLERSVKTLRAICFLLGAGIVLSIGLLFLSRQWPYERLSVGQLQILNDRGENVGAWSTIDGSPTLMLSTPTGGNSIVMRAGEADTGLLVRSANKDAVGLGGRSGRPYLAVEKDGATTKPDFRQGQTPD